MTVIKINEGSEAFWKLVYPNQVRENNLNAIWIGAMQWLTEPKKQRQCQSNHSWRESWRHRRRIITLKKQTENTVTTTNVFFPARKIILQSL